MFLTTLHAQSNCRGSLQIAFLQPLLAGMFASTRRVQTPGGVIDLHISNLCRELGPQSDGAERIRSVLGIGYLDAWPLRG
jgi:hypothetical protein